MIPTSLIIQYPDLAVWAITICLIIIGALANWTGWLLKKSIDRLTLTIDKMQLSVNDLGTRVSVIEATCQLRRKTDSPCTYLSKE
jgi:hypothetical protein